jgi:hypothetical protein
MPYVARTCDENTLTCVNLILCVWKSDILYEWQMSAVRVIA